jgi:hypothetical protein
MSYRFCRRPAYVYFHSLLPSQQEAEVPVLRFWHQVLFAVSLWLLVNQHQLHNFKYSSRITTNLILYFWNIFGIMFHKHVWRINYFPLPWVLQTFRNVHLFVISGERAKGWASIELLKKEKTIPIIGARGSVVVKALCYKLEGRGFDSRWGEFLNLPNTSGRTRPWGLLSL